MFVVLVVMAIAAFATTIAVILVGVIITILPYLIATGLFLMLIYALYGVAREYHRRNIEGPR